VELSELQMRYNTLLNLATQAREKADGSLSRELAAAFGAFSAAKECLDFCESTENYLHRLSALLDAESELNFAEMYLADDAIIEGGIDWWQVDEARGEETR